jgi:hypothetical protein
MSQLFRNILILTFVFYFNSITAQNDKENNNNIVFYDDSEVKWKLNFHLSPMFAKLNSNSYNSDVSGQFGYNAGIGLGYNCINFAKIKLGILLGIDYRILNSKINQVINDSAWTNDIDGDQVHVFEQGSIDESQKVSFLNIPIQLNFDYIVSDQWCIYLSSGYEFALVTSANYTSNVVLSRQGFYPKLNALIYDVDINGSSYFYPTNKSITNTKLLDINNSNNILCAFGLKYNLQPTKISFFAGLKTIIGINNISGYSGTSNYLIVNSDQSLNTLLGRGDKINISAYAFEFGVIIGLKGGRIRYKK